MSKTANFAGVDLGAESGRCMLGRFDGERVQLQEVHRFANTPVRISTGLHWDALRLFHEIKHGLGECGRQSGGTLAGIGVDTWGVDCALLGDDGALLGNPVCYRDTRTAHMLTEAFRRMPRAEIFEQTGIQFMPINALYMLLALQTGGSSILDSAATFLMMPDLFNYWLCGRKACEFTDTTTAQLVNPRTRAWATPLIEAFGFPRQIFPELVEPGTVLAPLLSEVAAEIGVQGVPIIAPGTHDTASAVAAVPAQAASYAYISSGTWSLVGVEVAQPVINPQALQFNLTNEGGVAGTFRLLKNVAGLWLVQESRRDWALRGEDFTYAQLAAMAEAAAPFGAVLDPDAPDFAYAGAMPAKIAAYCQRTRQSVPESKGALLRCIFESLALKQRYVLERIVQVNARQPTVIHIVGGGSQNQLLCQLTADACQLPVVAGPVEATALGNVLVQAMAVGLLSSLADVRAVVRRSVTLAEYQPRQSAGWDVAYARINKLMEDDSAQV